MSSSNQKRMPKLSPHGNTSLPATLGFQFLTCIQPLLKPSGLRTANAMFLLHWKLRSRWIWMKSGIPTKHTQLVCLQKYLPWVCQAQSSQLNHTMNYRLTCHWFSLLPVQTITYTQWSTGVTAIPGPEPEVFPSSVTGSLRSITSHLVFI